VGPFYGQRIIHAALFLHWHFSAVAALAQMDLSKTKARNDIK